ncbi:MAG: dTDP-glucose 4,6-dehydratase [Anaerolineae bacterium]|nr:dTDP-glucose 4,6-dehydratase [Anaerolineae bacterium]
MIKSTITRRRTLIVIDTGVIFLSFLLAGLIRFEVTAEMFYSFYAYQSLLWVSLLVRLPVYLFFGLYDRLWRYASLAEAMRIMLASLTSLVCIYLVNFLLLPAWGWSYGNSFSIFVLDGLLNTFLLGPSRFWLRIYWNYWLLKRKSRPVEFVGDRINTLVVGANDIGEGLVRHVKQHPELGVEIVGFLDENAAMHHMRVHDVPILGGYERIQQFVQQYDVNEVILTNSHASSEHGKNIEEWCRSSYLSVKTASSVTELFKLVDENHYLMRQAETLPRLPLKFKNVLVTGSAGFIGSNFVHHMLEAHPDYRIVVYDKLTYAGNLDNLRGLAEKYGEHYRFVRGDICDADAVARAIEQYEIDGIVNFAAETHVDRSLMTPGNFAQTNVYGTYVLLEQAKKYQLQRYHQVSTDEVYGQILQGSFKETNPIDCRSPYSASKAGGDVMALAYHTSFDLPVTISRGSNNIGPYQHVEKVVPLFTTNALDNLPLPVYGDGMYVRDYQYVRDHCEGIDLIFHRGRPGEVYNLGAGREMAAIDLAIKICDLLERPHHLIHFVQDRPGQDRRYSLDCSKVVALGWRPRHTPNQAIEKTVQWYVENEWWWRKIKQGEYRQYYHRQYGDRLKNATRAFLSPVTAPANGIG